MDRDYARVFAYILAQIAISRWTEGGKRIEEFLSYRFHPGQQVATFHAKKTEMQKQLLDLHPDYSFNPIIMMSLLLSQAYMDPTLQDMVLKVEKKLSKSEAKRIKWIDDCEGEIPAADFEKVKKDGDELLEKFMAHSGY